MGYLRTNFSCFNSVVTLRLDRINNSLYNTAMCSIFGRNSWKFLKLRQEFRGIYKIFFFKFLFFLLIVILF